jgi:hypothetical protein
MVSVLIEDMTIGLIVAQGKDNTGVVPLRSVQLTDLYLPVVIKLGFFFEGI